MYLLKIHIKFIIGFTAPSKTLKQKHLLSKVLAQKSRLPIQKVGKGSMTNNIIFKTSVIDNSVSIIWII